MTPLTIDGVSHVFGAPSSQAVLAVADIELGVAPGEFVSILGPSGCGKSTLVNITAGFISPTQGNVFLGDEHIVRPTYRIGVIFQEHALFPWMTVEKNVSFGPRMRGQNRNEYTARTDQLLKLVALDEFTNAYPSQLSGGMRQRVAIARALANEPSVLLMDEPFGALDAQTRRLMQDELIRIWQQTGQTILFVTHNIEEALLLSDRVVMMTARPGTIREIVPFDAERPRDTSSPDFIALEKKLSQIISEELVGGSR